MTNPGESQSLQQTMRIPLPVTPIGSALPLLALRLIASGPLLVACSQPVPMMVLPQPQGPGILRVAGDEVVTGLGTPVDLRGIAFGNRVWQDDLLPDEHHAEADYGRLRELGMNVVRFYLNYLTFIDPEAPGQYEEEGWKWLDDNIAWARANGIYLVLNLHVPPGGYQSLGEGEELWESAEAQERFIELWKAIGQRYRGEATIAGYDLLNEPAPTKDPEQWKDLAQRTIQAVRAVDPEHIFFIERFNAVQGDRSENADRNFVLVDDPNVVYEFHFYEPLDFTHQAAPWMAFAAEDQRYPDPSKVEVEASSLEFATATFDSPKLPAGDSDWVYYEGTVFKAREPELVGQPSLVCAKNHGKAYFDDLTLERLDDEGKVAEKVQEIDLANTAGWHFSTKDGSGHASTEKVGRGDDRSVSIAGSTDEASLGADVWRFRVERGASYRLSGWMKGEGVQEGATCQIRLDLFRSKVPVQARDKGYLAQELDAYASWGETHDVPLFLGEFGAIRAAFEQDRGGDRWTADMIDLLVERRIHFTYHDYHEDHFGLFFGDGSPPDPNDVNAALLEVFREKLAPPSAGAPPSLGSAAEP